MRIGLLLLLLLIMSSVVLVGCGSQQSYECKGGDRECFERLNQSMIQVIEKEELSNNKRMAWLFDNLTGSIAETCQFPKIEQMYQVRKTDEKLRGQFIVWCNEYNVRLQHSYELFHKKETLKQ